MYKKLFFFETEQNINYNLIKIIHNRDAELELFTARVQKLERAFLQKSQSEKIIDLERQLYSQQQYSRRETLEFVGICDSVEDKNLEKKVIELCDVAGVQVNQRSFHAVHRLKNRSTVIVKFAHRKDALNVLRNKKKLRETDAATKKRLNIKGKVFVNESLCTQFRRLFGISNALFKIFKKLPFFTTVQYGTIIEQMRKR